MAGGTRAALAASFDLGRNLFCSGHCFLPDGRLLVAAGQSWNFATQGIWGADHDIHTFDPTTESWSRYEDMPAARYYPTCVTLPDGIALICGGAWTRCPRPSLTTNMRRSIGALIARASR